MKKIAGIITVFCVAQSNAQNTIPIPDTLTGGNIALVMHTDSMQILPGKKTKTLAFNTHNFLGPTLLLNKWQGVNISVSNQIGDTTTVHWHGLHVPSKFDGGPHTLIMNGATWNPSFTVLNNASMYWYHPHFMGKTAEQAIKGASGLIIVRDSAEASLTLPRQYGIDDIPLIVKSLQLDSNNQFMPRGMEDSTLLVNGITNAQYNLPAQVVRLRLLNGSGERTLNFGFTASKPFYVIGTDGGLLNAPVAVTRIRLSPGERAEVLIDLTTINGQTIYLMSYGSELLMGVQGGPTMPMSGGPPMNSPLNGTDFNILKLNIVSATSNPVTTIPSSLVSVTPYLSSQANITRYINFTADSMIVMDGPFYFNDSTFDMMRIDYQIPLNNTEIWSLSNQTMVAHPFHLHDEQFFVLDRDGNAPAPEEMGWKDVVLVQPMETVRFITKFTDFVDSVIPYMYHCHILMHEDDGMMGQFVIMPQGWVGIDNPSSIETEVSIFPNPAHNRLRLQIKNVDVYLPFRISITDALGKEIYAGIGQNSIHEVLVSEWPTGFYIISLYQNQKSIHKKVIVE